MNRCLASDRSCSTCFSQMACVTVLCPFCTRNPFRSTCVRPEGSASVRRVALWLRLAPGTASGFYGVKKARKMWQATVYVEGKDVPQLELEPRAIDADLRRRCAIRLGPRAADGHLGWVRSTRASAQSTLTC